MVPTADRAPVALFKVALVILIGSKEVGLTTAGAVSAGAKLASAAGAVGTIRSSNASSCGRNDGLLAGRVGFRHGFGRGDQSWEMNESIEQHSFLKNHASCANGVKAPTGFIVVAAA